MDSNIIIAGEICNEVPTNSINRVNGEIGTYVDTSNVNAAARDMREDRQLTSSDRIARQKSSLSSKEVVLWHRT